MDLALSTALAIGYGILTVENDDAGLGPRPRSTAKNKGGDAARACLAMIELQRDFGLPAR